MSCSSKTKRCVTKALNEILGAPNPCNSDPYKLIQTLIAAAIPPNSSIPSELVPSFTKFVSPNWSSVPTALSSTTFFTSIQDAINQIDLERLSTSVPYQVQIYPGTYNENVTLSPNVSLIGFDRNTTIINGNVSYFADTTATQKVTLNHLQYTGTLSVNDRSAGTSTVLFKLYDVTTPLTALANISLTMRNNTVASAFLVLDSLLYLSTFDMSGGYVVLSKTYLNVATISLLGSVTNPGAFRFQGTDFITQHFILDSVFVQIEDTSVTASTTFSLTSAEMNIINSQIADTTAQISADVTSAIRLNGSTYDWSLLYSSDPRAPLIPTTNILCGVDRSFDCIRVVQTFATTTPVDVTITQIIPYITTYSTIPVSEGTVAFGTLGTIAASSITPTSFALSIGAPTITPSSITVLVTLIQPFATLAAV